MLSSLFSLPAPSSLAISPSSSALMFFMLDRRGLEPGAACRGPSIRKRHRRDPRFPHGPRPPDGGAHGGKTGASRHHRTLGVRTG